jgi:hypothetical protein
LGTIATVMWVDASDEEEEEEEEDAEAEAEADDEEAGAELAGAVVLDELLVTEQAASASTAGTATTASGRVRLDQRLTGVIVIFGDISSSFGRD